MTESTDILVLLVADDSAFADRTADTLSEHDAQFVVETAPSASEGLLRLSTGGYDCVVSDHEIPGQNGIEFLETVREERPGLPFILYTAEGTEAVASDAIAAGVTDYLRKGSGPGQYELLANRVRNAVEARREAERADRQEQLMRLTEFAGDTGGFELDGEHNTVLLTAGTRRIIGRPDAFEITLEEALELFHPDDREDIRRTLDRAFETGERLRGRWRLQPDDGDERLLDITTTPVVEDGEVTKLRGAGHDVTDRKERHRRLAQVETLFQHAQDPLFLVDVGKEFTIERVNAAWAEAIGASNEQVHNQTPRDVLGEQSGGVSEAKFRECVQRQEPLEYEETVRFDGESTDRATRIAPVVIDGTVEYIAGSTRDVTNRKERQQELRRNERAMDEAPVGITLSDPSREDNPLVYVNERFEEMTGYGEDETIGRNCRWLQGDDTRQDAVTRMREAIDAEEPVAVELRNYRKDGTEFWNRVSITPVYDDQGSVINFVGFQQDITDRKEREQELAQINDLMANMEVLADVGAWEYSSETDTLGVTDGTRRFYGLDPDEDLTLEAALDPVHPDDRALFADRLTNCVQKGTPYEIDIRFTTPDGQQRWLTVKAERILESDAGSVVRGYMRDSTEQQAYERDLKRYWTVFDELPDSVDRTDVDTNLEPEYTLQPAETTRKRLEWLLDTYQPIIEVLNRAATREEAEQTVCDFLTATRAYDVAWTVKYTPDTSVLDPHVRSDPEGNSSDGWEFPPMDSVGQQSLPRSAAETGGVRFVTDSDPDPDCETWREHVVEHGFSGSAIVPLTYKDNTYGLIGLYTTRASPFGNREQTLLQTVGDRLGRLFHEFFVEKQLYTDTISELTLRSEDSQSFFVRASEALGCTIEVLESVPTAEHTLTHYVSIRGAPVGEFVELAADGDAVREVRPIRHREDPPGGEVELKLSRQSLASTLVGLGAVVTTDEVTDGRARIVCEVPAGEDINSLVARVTDSFPETSLVSKTEYERSADSVRQTTTDLLADRFRNELTDRQRQILRTCLHGGYFESPRRSTATEIAEALSLTQPTVSRHLRNAQRKLFEDMFERV